MATDEERYEAAKVIFAAIPVELTTQEDVRKAVLEGRSVWSFGYGSDMEVDEFTTLDPEDLENLDFMWDAWKPFRYDPDEQFVPQPLTSILGYNPTIKVEDLPAAEEDDLLVCPADGEKYDHMVDLNHELHDSEHPNHHKFCDTLFVGHFHEIGSWVESWEASDDYPILPLESIRFSPDQALDRLSSFVSIFENDGATDVVTLDRALDTLNEFLNSRNPEHETYVGH